jgi:uncharacterized protein (DUF1330 family)
MAGYIIVELDVTDPELFAKYRDLVPPIIEQYGGKYIVRGGHTEVLEGDWNPKRIVVLEFESVQRAKEFMDSEEYAPVKQMRFDSANSNALVVEGA